jgi:hypothetical protein
MLHFSSSGKKCCVDFTTQVCSILWCAYWVTKSNGINICVPYQHHPNIGVPQTINNYDCIPIGLCIINHESLEIRFWKPVFQHRLIKLCPHDLLSFSVFKLHITN